MDTEMSAIDPRVQTQWRIEAGAVGAAVALGTLVAAALISGPTLLRLLIIVAGLAVASLLQWVVSIRYRHWRYGLADDVLILEHGVWTHRHSMTPYFRVQNVDVTQGPLERRLGLKQLTIRTASAFTDATIPGLDASAAESLRTRILERAGRDASV